MPKISIIVPVFNVEQYLERCLNSLVTQNLEAEEYEIILINDGSSDRSGMIAEHFSRQNPNIRFFSQENKGLGAARNAGLDIASGEYVWFVDSDDWISENCLKDLYQKAEEENLDMLLFNMVREHADGSSAPVEKVYSGQEASTGLHFFLTERLVVGPCHALYRRSMMERENIRFEEGVFYEDVDFFIKALLASSKVKWINESLYHYYANAASITQKKDMGHSNKKVSDYYAAAVRLNAIKQKMSPAAAQRMDYIIERYQLWLMRLLYRNSVSYETMRQIVTKMKKHGHFPIRTSQHPLNTDDRAQIFYFNHIMPKTRLAFEKRFGGALLLMKLNKRLHIL